MTIPATQAYLYNAPTGIPGDVTRPGETNVEPIMLGNELAAAFGIPLKYDTDGTAIPFAGSEAATAFAGVLVREVPSISGVSGSNDLSPNVPNPVQVQGMAVRGYVNVLCAVGTPVRGGTVYVQITASGGIAIGSFRADGTDGGNAVALTAAQAEWAVNGKDANNNAELRIAR